MNNNPIVKPLDEWIDTFRLERTKENAVGICRESIIEDALNSVLHTELNTGRTLTEEFRYRLDQMTKHKKFCDDDELWVFLTDFRLKKNSGPALLKTMAKELLRFVTEESGLMEDVNFRTLLGSRLDSYRQIIIENGISVACCDPRSNKEWDFFAFDTLKTAALNEKNIMHILILPLYFSHSFKRRFWKK